MVQFPKVQIAITSNGLFVKQVNSCVTDLSSCAFSCQQGLAISQVYEIAEKDLDNLQNILPLSFSLY